MKVIGKILDVLAWSVLIIMYWVDLYEEAQALALIFILMKLSNDPRRIH